MLNPGQAEPGGLGNLIAQQPSQKATSAGINPMAPQMAPLDGGQLLRMIEQNMQQNNSTPIAALAEISRRLTQAKNAKMEEGRRAAAMLAGQPATIKDELVQQALMAGIGSQPYEFAGGGLVAFADGGMAAEDIDTADLGGQDAFGVSPEFGLESPAALAADALRVENLPALRAAAFPPDAQELARQGRLIGIDVSPRDSEQVRAEKFQRIRDAIAAAKQRESQPRAEIPVPLTAGVQRPPYEQRGVVPAAGTRPAAAAAGARPAAAGAGARPGVAQVPTPDDIAQYTSAAESAIESMMGRGRPGAEELELRKALLAAQEAERLPSMEYKEPSGLTGRELLQLASFDPTKGRWMGSLAERAAGVMGAREAKAEEAKKANREIDIANRRLNTALAQQRLAYASTDRKAQEDADLAVANARVALREKVVQFGLESRKVGAQERQAGAAEIAANQRGGTRQELSPRDRANLRDKATDNVTKNPQTVLVITRAKAEAQRRGVSFDEQAFREQLVEREYQALLAAAEGRAAAPTAAADRVIDFSSIGNK